jgi:hypothetical protein
VSDRKMVLMQDCLLLSKEWTSSQIGAALQTGDASMSIRAYGWARQFCPPVQSACRAVSPQAAIERDFRGQLFPPSSHGQGRSPSPMQRRLQAVLCRWTLCLSIECSKAALGTHPQNAGQNPPSPTAADGFDCFPLHPGSPPRIVLISTPERSGFI